MWFSSYARQTDIFIAIVCSSHGGDVTSKSIIDQSQLMQTEPRDALRHAQSLFPLYKLDSE